MNLNAQIAVGNSPHGVAEQTQAPGDTPADIEPRDK